MHTLLSHISFIFLLLRNTFILNHILNHFHNDFIDVGYLVLSFLLSNYHEDAQYSLMLSVKIFDFENHKTAENVEKKVALVWVHHLWKTFRLIHVRSYIREFNVIMWRTHIHIQFHLHIYFQKRVNSILWTLYFPPIVHNFTARGNQPNSFFFQLCKIYSSFYLWIKLELSRPLFKIAKMLDYGKVIEIVCLSQWNIVQMQWDERDERFDQFEFKHFKNHVS